MKRKYYLFVGLFVLLLGLNNLLQIPQPKNEKHNLLTNLDLWTKDKDFRYTETKNLSPYAMFGDNSMVLRTKQEREGKHSLEIANQDMYSQIARLELDYKKGLVILIDKQGNIKSNIQLDNRDLAKFLSTDPLAPEYPELTPYQFASNTPIQAIDLDGLEAFYFHGTWDSDIENNWSALRAEGFKSIENAFGNKTHHVNQSWSGLNLDKERKKAANSYFDYIVNNLEPGEDITLVGHSHGGNVAIMVANMLVETGLIGDRSINIVTINIVLDMSILTSTPNPFSIWRRGVLSS